MGNDIIKDLKEIGWEYVDWIRLAQGRKRSVSVKGGEFLD
jgi:hypothetical protein